MKRFTVSLDEETYERLRASADARNPPATFQQMIRHAVEGFLGPEGCPDDNDEMPTEGGKPNRSDDPAEPAFRDDPEPTDLSTFKIGGVWFGLPVSRVEGIAGRTAVERLPTLRHDVSGAIRYRDTLLAVIDGSGRLGTASEKVDPGQHLVVRQPDGLVALAVDEVGSLVPLTGGTWHPPPAGAADDLHRLGVTALVDCGDRLVNVLTDFAV